MNFWKTVSSRLLQRFQPVVPFSRVRLLDKEQKAESFGTAPRLSYTATRNVGLIAFPWPMRFATWALSVLPAWINGLVNRLVPDKISSGRPKVL